jgi:C-8 sterol isomerase
MEYLFDPDAVHECALTGLGKPKPAMFDVIADALEARYPGRIDRTQPWIFSNAGGAMIQMKLYYASIFEYLMIWGTPIGSEGHSGRHAVGFWDTVVDGECGITARASSTSAFTARPTGCMSAPARPAR